MHHNKKECLKTIIDKTVAIKLVDDSPITMVHLILDLTLYILRGVIDRKDAIAAVDALYGYEVGKLLQRQLNSCEVAMDDLTLLVSPECHVNVSYISSQADDARAEALIAVVADCSDEMEVVNALSLCNLGTIKTTPYGKGGITLTISHPVTPVARYRLDITDTPPSEAHTTIRCKYIAVNIVSKVSEG